MSKSFGAIEALEQVRKVYAGLAEDFGEDCRRFSQLGESLQASLDALQEALNFHHRRVSDAVAALDEAIGRLQAANQDRKPGGPEPIFPEVEPEPTRTRKEHFKFFYGGVPYTNLRQACLHLGLTYGSTLSLVKQMGGDGAKGVAEAVRRKNLRESRRNARGE